MKSIKLWALMSDEGNGVWNIVGLYMPGTGHLPIVSSNERVVEKMAMLVSDDVRYKSKIVEFIGCENGATNA